MMDVLIVKLSSTMTIIITAISVSSSLLISVHVLSSALTITYLLLSTENISQVVDSAVFEWRKIELSFDQENLIQLSLALEDLTHLLGMNLLDSE